jgi:hypothetical protein
VQELQALKELQRQGMSIQGISNLTGWDRKTVPWNARPVATKITD